MKASKKTICTCVLISIFTLTSAAQEKTYIPFNQVRFSITPAMYDNLKIDNKGISNAFDSKPCFGGEITVSYYQNIVKGLGVNLGLGIASAPYNTKCDFMPDVENPSKISDSKYSPQAMMVVPLSLNMYIPGKGKSWLCNIELGAKLNLEFPYQKGELHYYGGPTIDGDVNIDDAVDDIKSNSLGWVEYSTKKQILFSYFMKVGFVKVMKNRNTWHLNAVANYSPQKLGKGSYMLHTVNGDSYGNFEQNINFIGLEVVYGFTLCKKKSTPDMRD